MSWFHPGRRCRSSVWIGRSFKVWGWQGWRGRRGEEVRFPSIPAVKSPRGQAGCPHDVLWSGHRFWIVWLPWRKDAPKAVLYLNKHNNKVSSQTYLLLLSLYQCLCVVTMVLAYFQPFPILLIHSCFSFTISDSCRVSAHHGSISIVCHKLHWVK